jgi:putative addiction module component (TIGR02574 family)
MTAAVSRILREIEVLSQEEQSEVADVLLQMLAPSQQSEDEEAFKQKLLQRVAAIESGQAKTTPLHEVLAEIRQNRR